MPYTDPMAYLGHYFRPGTQRAIQALPGIFQLQQRKKEFAARQPYLQAQTELARERVGGLRQTREDYRSLIEGGIPGFGELLPEGMTPETYFRGKKHGLFGPISMGRAKPAAGFTLGPGQVRFGPEGKEVAKVPPKAPKPPKPRMIDYTEIATGQHIKVPEGSERHQRIQENIIAGSVEPERLKYREGTPTKLTPTLPAPPRPPTEMQLMTTQRQIETRKSALEAAKFSLQQTGIADPFIAMVAEQYGKKLSPGQPVDKITSDSLIAQWEWEISMLSQQLETLGFPIAPPSVAPSPPTPPSLISEEGGSFIQRFRKGKR